MDGLVHVSQVTDDYINYDGKRGALIGKESKKPWKRVTGFVPESWHSVSRVSLPRKPKSVSP
jgi:hypothetical protein